MLIKNLKKISKESHENIKTAYMMKILDHIFVLDSYITLFYFFYFYQFF